MEGDTDTFEELLKLCEEFMQTAIGLNNNLGSSSWMHALNDYKEFSKGIMKCRVRQQRIQQGTLLKIQQLEERTTAEKENASLMKKKIDVDECDLTGLKQHLTSLNDEEKGLNEEIERLKKELIEAKLAFHRSRLAEASRQKKRLEVFREVIKSHTMELQKKLPDLTSSRVEYQKNCIEASV